MPSNVLPILRYLFHALFNKDLEIILLKISEFEAPSPPHSYPHPHDILFTPSLPVQTNFD